jgi:hypothetical protein
MPTTMTNLYSCSRRLCSAILLMTGSCIAVDPDDLQGVVFTGTPPPTTVCLGESLSISVRGYGSSDYWSKPPRSIRCKWSTTGGVLASVSSVAGITPGGPPAASGSVHVSFNDRNWPEQLARWASYGLPPQYYKAPDPYYDGWAVGLLVSNTTTPGSASVTIGNLTHQFTILTKVSGLWTPVFIPDIALPSSFTGPASVYATPAGPLAFVKYKFSYALGSDYDIKKQQNFAPEPATCNTTYTVDVSTVAKSGVSVSGELEGEWLDFIIGIGVNSEYETSLSLTETHSIPAMPKSRAQERLWMPYEVKKVKNITLESSRWLPISGWSPWTTVVSSRAITYRWKPLSGGEWERQEACCSGGAGSSSTAPGITVNLN